MARYLTSSKIALLYLICVHNDGLITTDAIGPVLSFLLSRVIPDNAPGLSFSDADDRNVIPLSVFEAFLALHASVKVGRSLWDTFLVYLWSADTANALHDFMTALPRLLSKSREQIQLDSSMVPEARPPAGKIVRTSPLGSFIRRCQLEWDRLHFEDTAHVWVDFVAYRAETGQAYDRKHAPDQRHSLDANLASFGIDANHPIAQIVYGRLESEEESSSGFSAFDVERLMEYQVSELQRIGGRIPDGLKARFNKMSQTGNSVPHIVHYLKFLDFWRAGDYSSAHDNLRRYFDYTMHSRDRTFYQYALLNLAILHADFSHFKEAVSAMQEAIATARENKDSTCLNFCMSWLYHFDKTFPGEVKELRDSGLLGNEEENINFLMNRAKDAEMWSLLSTAHLSKAKSTLQKGDNLSTVFEIIAKASHINVTKTVGPLSGSGLLMKASVFGRVGLSQLASSYGNLFLQSYSNDATAEDLVKCTCRLASLLAQRGRYDEASASIDNLPERILRVLKYQKYIAFYRGMLMLRRFLHQNNLDGASEIMNRLQGQGAPDLDLKLSLALLDSNLQARLGQMEAAMKIVDDLGKTYEAETPDVLAQVKLLNAKAALWARCGEPMKGFTIIVRAANTAYRAHILSVLWESIAILSNVLNALSEHVAAISLLSAIVPQVLECRDCALAATVYSHLADGYMGLAGREEKHNRRTELLNQATEYIDLAFDQWRQVEDLDGQLEILHKKATIMKVRGDLGLANDLASHWFSLRKQYQEDAGMVVMT